ncbi:hypothetical protein OG948_21225 [Embleya sp. NBC_00888]|uniref:hypothetical protein n=1 Tax=Embleya sp. NBC_00888 TaxID=2975960 RepID=UPI00386E7172|nr:hypothetical protein OG948_21225 [Embleya sp. NBC_00888]
MTVRVSWLYPSPGTNGGQSREDTRLTPIGRMWPTGPTTTRSGVIPGGNPLSLTGSGMGATIGLGQAVVQGTTAQGAYSATVTVPHAVTVGNGHASLPRIDVIALRVYDHIYDTSGQYAGDIVVVQGAANAAPVVPAMPSPTTMPLYRITVPAGASAGTGGLTWGGATDMRAYTVAVGGILPVDASNATGSYIGQVRIVSGRLTQWDGSAWSEFTLPSTLAPSTWGAWTAYTPVLAGGGASLGNGSLVGAWSRVGRLITARVAFTLGSTTTQGSGYWTFTLPVQAAAVSSGHAGLGHAMATDAGTAIYQGIAFVSGGASDMSAFSNAQGSPWGPARPFTWGTNDSLTLLATYEAAA